MAITKLESVKTTNQQAIDYIINFSKTYCEKLNDYLVDSFECDFKSAYIQFDFTKQIAKQVKGDYSKVDGKDISAWILYISYTYDDTDKISKEIVDEFLQDNYQYVLGTHSDKFDKKTGKVKFDSHCIFNATSYKTFNKFDTKRNIEYLRLREISNKICNKYGLDTIEYEFKLEDKKHKIYPQKNIKVDLNKKDKSFKSILKNDIDSVIKSAINFENFIDRMKNLGYEIIEDKNGLGFKSPEQKYYTRIKSLGIDYSKNYLLKIIENNKSLKSKLEKTPIRNDNFTPTSIEDLLSPKDVLTSNISWRAKLKYCIDYYIFKSKNFDEFLQEMSNIGYTIKYGKHIAFRCAGMDKNIRAKVLGENYAEEMIKQRIENNLKTFPQVPFIAQSKEVKLENSIDKPKVSIKRLIDIHNNEKYKNELYYQKFVRRYNTNDDKN